MPAPVGDDLEAARRVEGVQARADGEGPVQQVVAQLVVQAHAAGQQRRRDALAPVRWFYSQSLDLDHGQELSYVPAGRQRVQRPDDPLAVLGDKGHG
jgi:hypothetical protein